MRFYLAACPTSFNKCPLAAAAAAKNTFHCSPQQFSLLKKLKQCWPLLFRHLFQTATDKPAVPFVTWDTLLVDSVCTGAKGVMTHAQVTCRRQTKGGEEEKTLWQEGEKSFAGKNSAHQWWEGMINEESDPQKQFILHFLPLQLPGICHQGNSCLKF